MFYSLFGLRTASRVVIFSEADEKLNYRADVDRASAIASRKNLSYASRAIKRGAEVFSRNCERVREERENRTFHLSVY